MFGGRHLVRLIKPKEHRKIYHDLHSSLRQLKRNRVLVIDYDGGGGDADSRGGGLEGGGGYSSHLINHHIKLLYNYRIRTGAQTLKSQGMH